MDARLQIERYGGVLKEEPISCVENDFLLKHTCVLEAVSPYFGYYSEVKSPSRPHMLYFVLDGYYSLEALTRATLNIRKQVKFPIDAVTGTITLFNQTCYVIRLLDLQNYSHIAMLQDLYQKEGVMFKKKSRSFTNEMAMIKLRRFFSLHVLTGDMYLEVEQPNIGYFEIPTNIAWDNFKRLTVEAKYDTNLLYFDAARAYFYEGHGIKDLVRIYREGLTPEKLEAIKDRYIKLLQ